MKEWFKNLLTDANGDADETVIYAFVGMFTYFGLTITSVIMSTDHHFDAASWGTGFAAIMVAVLGGYGAKARLERKSDER